MLGSSPLYSRLCLGASMISLPIDEVLPALREALATHTDLDPGNALIAR